MTEMSALTGLLMMMSRELEDELEDMLEDCHVRVFFTFLRDVRKMSEMSALADIFLMSLEKMKKNADMSILYLIL